MRQDKLWFQGMGFRGSGFHKGAFWQPQPLNSVKVLIWGVGVTVDP